MCGRVRADEDVLPLPLPPQGGGQVSLLQTGAKGTGNKATTDHAADTMLGPRLA